MSVVTVLRFHVISPVVLYGLCKICIILCIIVFEAIHQHISGILVGVFAQGKVMHHLCHRHLIFCGIGKAVIVFL